MRILHRVRITVRDLRIMSLEVIGHTNTLYTLKTVGEDLPICVDERA